MKLQVDLSVTKLAERLNSKEGVLKSWFPKSTSFTEYTDAVGEIDPNARAAGTISVIVGASLTSADNGISNEHILVLVDTYSYGKLWNRAPTFFSCTKNGN